MGDIFYNFNPTKNRVKTGLPTKYIPFLKFELNNSCILEGFDDGLSINNRSGKLKKNNSSFSKVYEWVLQLLSAGLEPSLPLIFSYLGTFLRSFLDWKIDERYFLYCQQ